MAAVGVLAGVGLVGVGLFRGGDGGVLSLTSASGGATSSPTPTGPSPEELAAQARAKRAKDLTAALTKYAVGKPEFSVAVLDKKTGQKFSFRGTEKYDTASIVKVQVLGCLLLKAQDKDRDLTSSELAKAKLMIRLSDNNATTSLFTGLGGKSAVTACNKRLGLTQTVVNSAWGLTRTTVDDQIKLLGQLVDPKSPLDADSRKLAFTLMNSVDKTQEWGVPAAAKPGEEFTVKNGWDTRTADNGLWAVNSVGRITSDDTDVSLAVLSHRNATMDSGISEVETVAKMTRQYLKY
ncbi:serine hydrolase [Actinoplanes sp. TBRC 11911]|uniref:serine hydrolase n=1 Tax=Actinoplanes sp. TBRC 11911 TaxID=2729386 RepID=UPI00289D82AB|nr:serine hydrolase [Actinoplanes sp. TBRC 11911]